MGGPGREGNRTALTSVGVLIGLEEDRPGKSAREISFNPAVTISANSAVTISAMSAQVSNSRQTLARSQFKVVFRRDCLEAAGGSDHGPEGKTDGGAGVFG
jgi:hypothetical protein